MKLFSIKQGYEKRYRVLKYQFCGLTIFRKEILLSGREYRFRFLKIPFFKKKITTDKILCYTNENFPITEYRSFPNEFSFPKFTESPLVSIIIPAFNQFYYSMRCLYSILKNTPDIPYEVIVADDCSTDKTQNINHYVKNIHVIHSKTQLGYVRNCNQAASKAQGKFICFLNNDTQVQPFWLKELLAVFHSNPDAGIVGSKLLYDDGLLQECGSFVFKGTHIHQDRFDRNPFDSKYTYVKKCDFVSGAAYLTRKDLWDQIGGLDERFSPAYCDDVDFCLEAKKHGKEIYVTPFSLVVHSESKSYSQNKVKLSAANNIKLQKKWKSFLENQASFSLDKLPFSSSKRPSTVLFVSSSKNMYSLMRIMEQCQQQGMCIKWLNTLPPTQTNSSFRILNKKGIEVLCSNTWKTWIWQHIEFIDYIVLSEDRKNLPFILDILKFNLKKIKLVYIKQSDTITGMDTKLIELVNLTLCLNKTCYNLIKNRFPNKNIYSLSQQKENSTISQYIFNEQKDNISTIERWRKI